MFKIYVKGFMSQDLHFALNKIKSDTCHQNLLLELGIIYAGSWKCTFTVNRGMN